MSEYRIILEVKKKGKYMSTLVDKEDILLVNGFILIYFLNNFA